MPIRDDLRQLTMATAIQSGRVAADTPAAAFVDAALEQLVSAESTLITSGDVWLIGAHVARAADLLASAQEAGVRVANLQAATAALVSSIRTAV